ncbi:non-specific serine/threonine protein kinase [Salvia divinorum]|uniref:Non-specific serine/threonine protein kinase n=1 Tax=Salvia divinorum TaxID=28513 RepID=A0ABD1FUX9_SALDI
MATSFQTLIPLLATLALFLTVADAQRPRPPPRRTSFTVTFNGSRPADLTFQGDAYFPPGATNLRLTKTDVFGNALLNTAGRVLYSNPIRFLGRRRRARASFETNVRFVITPNRGDTNPPADGLVFFIAPVNSTPDASGGSFGVFDLTGKKTSVFAVEFDIFSNEWDPSFRHVGIDIQSQVSSNVTAVDDAILGQEVTARIDYNAATNLIRVNGSVGAKAFEVSYVYDLSTILPQEVQVGISAATGGLAAVHDVVAWSFTSTMRRRRPNRGEHI